MFEVKFFNSSNDSETIVNQKFNTFIDAQKWAEDCEYDYQDIAIDDSGNEYWKTIYRYYNPEDREAYTSYEVKEIIN
jgi:hypothetical protein